MRSANTRRLITRKWEGLGFQRRDPPSNVFVMCQVLFIITTLVTVLTTRKTYIVRLDLYHSHVSLRSLDAELGECRLLFNETKYTVTVTETPANDSTIDSSPSTPVVGAVVTTMCTGDDGTPTQGLRYSILEGDVNAFSIDVMTGQFSVSHQPFDYEEQQWYLVTLLCYLASDHSTNGTGEVNVTIAPINEYLPVITGSSGSNIIQLHEDKPVGISVASTIPGMALFTYTATDKDIGPGGKIIFAISSSSMDYFDLNLTTGRLSLQRELDFDNLQGENPVNIFITACNEKTSR